MPASQCVKNPADLPLCKQAVSGREAALQQVEEARLALRAAERDNAQMQARLQQAAASSRQRHPQQHEPTARQLWAGSRDRATAYGSLAASPVSRYCMLSNRLPLTALIWSH